jgi:hypothetical protein
MHRFIRRALTVRCFKREDEPRDIEGSAFLIKDADYITGQVIPVDDGRTLRDAWLPCDA